jgi:hypothetical protein
MIFDVFNVLTVTVNEDEIWRYKRPVVVEVVTSVSEEPTASIFRLRKWFVADSRGNNS